MKSCTLMCKNGHTQMRHQITIPHLVESMTCHKKSLYIVLKMPETIAIYSNVSNVISLNISKIVQHVQLCAVQNGKLREVHPISDMDLGNPCDVS